MPTELKNIKVDFLSLVAKGANGKKIIYKSGANRPAGAEEIGLMKKSFVKSDDRQMVYAVVYSPDEVDAQGEFAKASAIEAAAYDFMRSRNVLNVDVDHDFDPKAAFVAESWIVKGVDTLFPEEREGAWAVGIRVEDPELWARVKKGELEGISMAGCAIKVRKSDENEGGGFLTKLEEMLGRLLKSEQKEKTGKQEEAQEDKDASLDDFVVKIAKAVKDEAAADIGKRLDDFAERLEKIEKSTLGKTSNGVGGDDKNAESCGIV